MKELTSGPQNLKQVCRLPAETDAEAFSSPTRRSEVTGRY